MIPGLGPRAAGAGKGWGWGWAWRHGLQPFIGDGPRLPDACFLDRIGEITRICSSAFAKSRGITETSALRRSRRAYKHSTMRLNSRELRVSLPRRVSVACSIIAPPMILTGCGKSQPISLGGAAPGEKESRGAAVRNIRALTAVPPYQSFAHAVPRRGGHLFPQPA